MTPTTQAILNSVALSDPSLSPSERTLLQQLVSGRAGDVTLMPAEVPLLLTQKEAARILGISRVSLWRLTKEAVFNPVEIFAGRFRYRREEVEAVARGSQSAAPRRPFRKRR